MSENLMQNPCDKFTILLFNFSGAGFGSLICNAVSMIFDAAEASQGQNFQNANQNRGHVGTIIGALRRFDPFDCRKK